MTPEEFFAKVESMRKLQKEYFKTRAPSSLSMAKRLEAEIDAEIVRVRMIKPDVDNNNKQTNLFN